MNSWVLATALALVALAAPASADQEASDGACENEVVVQYDLRHNEKHCSSCTFMIIIQVGLDNDTSCRDICMYNVFIQVGLGHNFVHCGSLPVDLVSHVQATIP